MAIILIGIDDTDNETSRGTGYLARRLNKECRQRGIKSLSVTRHQFLLDKRIRYTSHNSGACVAVESKNGIAEFEFVYDFVADSSAEGSDPGVCVALLEKVPDEVMEFGRAATCRVLRIAEALQVAREASIDLRGLGGTHEGVIGALGSVGLRAQGNEGRFIDLPGLRDLPNRVKADKLCQIGIRLEYPENHRKPDSDDDYKTLGWVRPRLMGGEPVLPVEWNEKYHAWIPVDRKKSRPLE